MYVSTVLMFASSVLAASPLVMVTLTADYGDYLPGPRLLKPENVIGQPTIVDSTKMDANAFSDQIKAQCTSNADCTSAGTYTRADFPGDERGTPKFFHGYLFRGGATTPGDYVKNSDNHHPITNAQYWTVAGAKHRAHKAH